MSPQIMRKMYGLIGGISALVMIIAVVCNDIADSLISDVVKNLAFGCVASTLVALLIEVGNTKEKTKKQIVYMMQCILI